MPSLEHNALVQLFRDRPTLVPRLLAELLGMEIPEGAAVSVVEAGLDQLLPIEYRADLVVEVRAPDGALVLAVVVEVQLAEDAGKKYSWPVYATVLRARKRCPAIVLVVTPYENVASWAAMPIALGVTHGDGIVRPRVLGPAQLPRITDSAVAACAPELGVLSALAHGNGPEGLDVIMAALMGLERLDEERAGVYFHVVYGALRGPVRRALEALLMNRVDLSQIPTPPFLQGLVERRRVEWLREGKTEGLREGKAEGLREGKAEGLREGKAEGLREGRAEGLREALMEFCARTGVTLTAPARERIAACSDADMLKRWIDNALTARTAEDLLA
ncbi:hypothetical protein [Chondromyces apiculatus]|uniref:Uncharacterized protein n=1 Tax=Chondromyces apiculatus DSM 436 TaxID=1192034 RepID=A0A017TGG0_9BACT|nr:hypothetical protein [Chondromyces apiculatus]EYF07905.1 Hypothetical protein CAP_6927 [Chondromyces apiculatus DSM 436]